MESLRSEGKRAAKIKRAQCLFRAVQSNSAHDKASLDGAFVEIDKILRNIKEPTGDYKALFWPPPWSDQALSVYPVPLEEAKEKVYAAWHEQDAGEIKLRDSQNRRYLIRSAQDLFCQAQAHDKHDEAYLDVVFAEMTDILKNAGEQPGDYSALSVVSVTKPDPSGAGTTLEQAKEQVRSVWLKRDAERLTNARQIFHSISRHGYCPTKGATKVNRLLHANGYVEGDYTALFANYPNPPSTLEESQNRFAALLKEGHALYAVSLLDDLRSGGTIPSLKTPEEIEKIFQDLKFSIAASGGKVLGESQGTTRLRLIAKSFGESSLLPQSHKEKDAKNNITKMSLEDFSRKIPEIEQAKLQAHYRNGRRYIALLEKGIFGEGLDPKTDVNLLHARNHAAAIIDILERNAAITPDQGRMLAEEMEAVIREKAREGHIEQAREAFEYLQKGYDAKAYLSRYTTFEIEKGLHGHLKAAGTTKAIFYPEGPQVVSEKTENTNTPDFAGNVRLRRDQNPVNQR